MMSVLTDCPTLMKCISTVPFAAGPDADVVVAAGCVPGCVPVGSGVGVPLGSAPLHPASIIKPATATMRIRRGGDREGILSRSRCG
jgi:hypothetical protein